MRRLALALLFLSAGTPALAETVRLDQGFVALDSEGGLYFTTGSAHFAVQRTGFEFPWGPTGLGLNCAGTSTGCARGELLTFANSTNGSVSLGHGNAYYNNTFYPDVDFHGSWRFTSRGARVPTSGEFGSVTAPFHFVGTLSGMADGRQIFAVDLLGFGHARLNLLWNGVGFKPEEAASLGYKFTGTDPVPEPASLVLLGTGLAGLVARRRITKGAPSR